MHSLLTPTLANELVASHIAAAAEHRASRGFALRLRRRRRSAASRGFAPRGRTTVPPFAH